MREAGFAWGAQVCADAVVQVAAAEAERFVGFAEVVAAFVESAEFLQGRGLDVVYNKGVMGIMTTYSR